MRAGRTIDLDKLDLLQTCEADLTEALELLSTANEDVRRCVAMSEAEGAPDYWLIQIGQTLDRAAAVLAKHRPPASDSTVGDGLADEVE